MNSDLLKFRAWLKNEQKMVEARSLHLGTRKITYGYSDGPQNYGSRSCKFEDCILMPRLPAQDVRGKDIFDGDILRQYQTAFGSSWIDYYYIFCGEDGDWRYRYLPWSDKTRSAPLFGSADHHKLSDELHTMEVIGNAYENPELVKRFELIP